MNLVMVLHARELRAFVRLCVRACLRACVFAYVFACVRVRRVSPLNTVVQSSACVRGRGLPEYRRPA